MRACSFPHHGGLLTDLDHAEWRRLLASISVGQSGCATPPGLRIMSSDHALLLDGDAVRTAASGDRALSCTTELTNRGGRRVLPG